MSSELLSLSAIQQGQLIKNGHISCSELFEFYASRIEIMQDRLQAFASLCLEKAQERAVRLDESLRRDPDVERSPFYGLPTGIKDMNLMKGTLTSMGSRLLENFRSPMDDSIVTAVKNAGFVIAGKLAAPEFGAMPVTEPDIHPPTRNPWNTDYTPGGSSGGSCAAVAAGLLPIAHANDGAGSTRIPASFGYLVGMKASCGALPNPHQANDPFDVVGEGGLARTVDDLGAFLDVLSMGDSNVSGPRFSFLESSRKPLGRLKVRFCTSCTLTETDAEIRQATLKVVKMLGQFHHHIEEAETFQGLLEDYLPVYQWQLAQAPFSDDEMLQPITRWLRQEGRKHSYEECKGLVENLRARARTWYGDTDLLVTPTVAVPPPKVGAWNHLEPEAAFREAAKLGGFSALFNVTGQPAVNIPAGFTRSGLPIGVQLVGPLGQDGRVLAVARQLEEVMPWRHRHSPLFGEG